MKRMTWTPELVATLRQLWAEHKTTREIAEIMGISRGSVSSRLSRLGLFGGRGPETRRWTPEEDQFLIDHYRHPEWPAKRIAEHLGRPIGSIRGKAQYFGLQQPGVDYKVKPADVEARAITLAMQDVSTTEIARRLNVSAGWVWKIINQRPALHRQWIRRNGERRGESMRRAHAEGRHPGPGWRVES